MTKGDLDGVTIWNRPIKPVALGACVAMANLTVFNILDEGVFRDLILGDVISVIAGASLILMLLGWFGKSQTMAEFGLLTGWITWTLRGAFLLVAEGLGSQSLYFSVSGAIILGGAYLLEMWDHRNHPYRFGRKYESGT